MNQSLDPENNSFFTNTSKVPLWDYLEWYIFNLYYTVINTYDEMRKNALKYNMTLLFSEKFPIQTFFHQHKWKKVFRLHFFSEKMSHLHIYLQLDTFSNFYFTFDIFEIIFWAIVCCLVLLKNWQICGLGILYPLMIDISFIPPETFTISIILKVNTSE